MYIHTPYTYPKRVMGALRASLINRERKDIVPLTLGHNTRRHITVPIRKHRTRWNITKSNEKEEKSFFKTSRQCSMLLNDPTTLEREKQKGERNYYPSQDFLARSLYIILSFRNTQFNTQPITCTKSC